MTLDEFVAIHRSELITLAGAIDTPARGYWLRSLLAWFAAAADEPDRALSEDVLQPVLFSLAGMLFCQTRFLPYEHEGKMRIAQLPRSEGFDQVESALVDLLAYLTRYAPELAERLGRQTVEQIRADLAFAEDRIRTAILNAD